MRPPAALVDTDILSTVLLGKAAVMARALAYLEAHDGQFTFSIITRYEILKGLKARGASAQTRRFEEFCAKHIMLPLTDAAAVQAVDIYADPHRRGELVGEPTS